MSHTGHYSCRCSAQTGYDMALVETEHILFINESFTNFLVMAH